jgi:hypothetical protein
VVRQQAGTSSTHNGITLDIAAQHGDGSGTVVIAVHAHADAGAFQALHVNWGDTPPWPQPPAFDCQSVPTDTPVTQAPFDYATSVSHAYVLPGTYHIEVDIVVPTQCPNPGEVDRWSFAQTDITVDDGHGGNGPTEPQLDENVYQEPGGVLRLFPSAYDDDGWIQDVTIDWGDGSPVLTIADSNPCYDHDGQSFASGLEMSPGEQHHSYPTPGNYTVTVTATSSACDGTGIQTATNAIQYAWN